ncbi:isoprenoid synthase domain-containing protein [Aspergillus karnatakaensis]|uniref:FPP/GGPP synthase family protein n=1 Tax=Aspergillus karnatakaensis TaxID=1810916 RepID=UPI003CCD81A8
MMFDTLNAPQPYQEHYPPRWHVHPSLPFTNGHSATPNGKPAVAVTNGEGADHQHQLDPKDKEEEIISAPVHYITTLPGKDIRGKLISAFNEWFQIPDEQLEIIKRAVGLLHVASLLIDDIEDYSKLRRGFPVAHSIFGIPQTINAANYAYFQAQSEVLKLRRCEDALRIFTDELLRLHRGQGMDLYWRDSLTCPSEDEYLAMVANKTGGLFRLAIKLIQLESDIDEFIRDDYQNLQSEQYAKNKGFGEDITEGKFSYPIVHSIRGGSGSEGSLQLLNILRQKTEDEAVKEYAIRILEKTGSFEYTRQTLRDLTARAREMLAGLREREREGERETAGAAGLLGILDFLELKE